MKNFSSSADHRSTLRERQRAAARERSPESVLQRIQADQRQHVDQARHLHCHRHPRRLQRGSRCRELFLFLFFATLRLNYLKARDGFIDEIIEMGSKC